MKKPVFAFALAAGSLIAAPGHAGGWAVGAKLGTLGLGPEIYRSLTPTINVRAGFNTFSFDDSDTQDDVTYDYEVDLNTVGAMLDWHVFNGGFRLSAGALANGNEISMIAKPTGTYTIGNQTYTAADVGTLTGKVDFESVAPYLGLGWGNPVGIGKRMSLNVDIGVLFTGSPVVALGANGALANDATFQTNLEREEQNLQEEYSDVELFPVAALGLTYQF